MNIPLSTIEPFGVLGFPKPLELGIREEDVIADSMAMIQSLSIEKQEIVAKVRKLSIRWHADDIPEATETHGIYEVKDGTWNSQK